MRDSLVSRKAINRSTGFVLAHVYFDTPCAALLLLICGWSLDLPELSIFPTFLALNWVYPLEEIWLEPLHKSFR